MNEFIKTTLIEYGLSEIEAQVAADEIMDELHNRITECTKKPLNSIVEKVNENHYRVNGVSMNKTTYESWCKSMEQ